MDWTAMIKDMSPRQGAEQNVQLNDVRLNWCMAARTYINKISCGCHRPVEMWVSNWKRYSDFVSKLKV